MFALLSLYVCAALPVVMSAFHDIDCAVASMEAQSVQEFLFDGFKWDSSSVVMVEGCVRSLPLPHGLRAFLLHDCDGEGRITVLSASDVEVGGMDGHRVRLHASPHGPPQAPAAPLLLLDPNLPLHEALQLCQSPAEQLSISGSAVGRKLLHYRGYYDPDEPLSYAPEHNPHWHVAEGSSMPHDRHADDLVRRKLSEQNVATSTQGHITA